MKETTYAQIVDPEEIGKAILNEGYIGFREDYLVLHCLIRKYKPKTFLEIGTNMGVGTGIICNAAGADCKVYSLDLPPELAHISLQSPGSESKGAYNIGSRCKFPFEQLYGNSMEYDYSKHYPIDGWFIDAEHVYPSVLHESSVAYKSGARLIVWHDSDMPEVMNGIQNAHSLHGMGYKLTRVKDTRITYATKSDSND